MNIIEAINTLYLRAVELDNYAERKEMLDAMDAIHTLVPTPIWVKIKNNVVEDYYYIVNRDTKKILDRGSTLSSMVATCNANGWAIRGIAL